METTKTQNYKKKTFKGREYQNILYSKSLITRNISLPINYIGSNINENI